MTMLHVRGSGGGMRMPILTGLLIAMAPGAASAEEKKKEKTL
jgi:hypothetical protein